MEMGRCWGHEHNPPSSSSAPPGSPALRKVSLTQRDSIATPHQQHPGSTICPPPLIKPCPSLVPAWPSTMERPKGIGSSLQLHLQV